MLIAVCSIKGSPGVTTLSVALAAVWPDRQAECMVVEVDPAGGDIGTWFDLPLTPGLVSIAARSRLDDDPELVWRHVQRLPGGLPVVPAPVRADQARAALTTLDAAHLRRASEPEHAVVVADCGRLDAGSPATPIAAAADRTLVVTRAQTTDLMHVASRVPDLVRTFHDLHLVLVGHGHAPDEVARDLGVPIIGTAPDDRRDAALLAGSPMPRTSWLSRRRLSRSAARIAAALAAAAPEPAPAAWDDLDLAGAAEPNGHGPARGRP